MSANLWTATQLQATLALPHIDPHIEASGVSIDTRSLEKGDLFIALTGAQQDGHNYVTAAFEKGATAALVRQAYKSEIDDPRLLRVADTHAALEALGAAARARTQAKIIGITGSVGKTSMKDMLHHCLSESGRCHASAKSYNNAIGVPLSLARMPADCDYAIFEMGMNHSGEIARLTTQVKPHIAVLGHIGAAHSGNFASEEDIAHAKAEIFSGLQGQAIAILPRDNKWYDVLATQARAQKAHILTYSTADKADSHIRRYKLHADYSCVDASIDQMAVTYKISLIGKHHILNSLAVLMAVKRAGGDMALAALSLSHIEASAGRGQRYDIPLAEGAFTLIDESYNASPDSMRAAIDVLAHMPCAAYARRIAVLGDMNELGENAVQAHCDLADYIMSKDIDVVHSCGTHMRHLHDSLSPAYRGQYAPHSDALIEAIADDICPGDVVMVKASHAMQMYRLVAHFTARGGSLITSAPHKKEA